MKMFLCWSFSLHFPLLLSASISLLFTASVKLWDTKEKVTHYFIHYFLPSVSQLKGARKAQCEAAQSIPTASSLSLPASLAPPPTHGLFMAWIISMGTDGRLIGFGLLMGKLLSFCWQRKCWAAAASYCLTDNGKNTSSAFQHSRSGLKSAAGLSCP